MIEYSHRPDRREADNGVATWPTLEKVPIVHLPYKGRHILAYTKGVIRRSARIMGVALAAALAVVFGSVRAADGVATVGKPAPPFLLDTLSGDSLAADFKGKPAFINVFATWCPPCRSEIPEIVRESARYDGRVTFIFVDEQESPNRVKAFVKQHAMPDPIGIDQGQFAATYGAGSIPESIFIDRHGIVRMVYKGPIPKSVLAGELAKLAAHDS